MQEGMDEEARHVRLGENEGGFRQGDCKEVRDLASAEDVDAWKIELEKQDRLRGDPRDQDDGAGGSRSLPPENLCARICSINRGTSGRKCIGKWGDNGGGSGEHFHVRSRDFVDGGGHDGHR